MEFKNNLTLYKASTIVLLVVLVAIVGKHYLITPANDESRLVHKDDISVDTALRSIGVGIKSMKTELDSQKLGVMIDKIELNLNLSANQTENGKTRISVAANELADMGVNIGKFTDDNRNSSIMITFKSLAQHNLDVMDSVRGMNKMELEALGLANEQTSEVIGQVEKVNLDHDKAKILGDIDKVLLAPRPQ